MLNTRSRQLASSKRRIHKVNLENCMTEPVESLHAAHHHKHDAGAHVLDYARSFGNTVKEGLKRTTIWSTYYFTTKKSYYPIPERREKVDIFLFR